ncbi:CDC50/LEM3 family [Obelidium mucronatum]|nr:CDC50/LEM3 family [Obelidium mucronatum]
MDATKSKRPANTAFKQQRLKAWQPILTPKTVLPAFFILGVVFVPIGIGLYIASNNVQQIMFDYTNCDSNPQIVEPVKSMKYDTTKKVCTVTFNVPSDMQQPVYMYYRLTNFYQNHRRYVKSFDANQLANLGVSSNSPPPAPTSVCSPLSKPTDAPAGTYSWVPNNQFDPNAVIYPCGLIANSYFSDVISDLTPVTLANKSPVVFSSSGLAWPSDSAKFQTSSLFTAGTVSGNLSTLVFPPPQWVTAFPGQDFSKGYTVNNFPDVGKMERFQVWMRPAGLPNFRKLWGKLEKDLLAGDYTVEITNNFNVNTFGGTKSIVISTVSILGGKNPFLGISYIVVGIVCWILGLLFLLRHMVKPRKLGDYTYLSWNQPQRGAAQAEGAAGAGPSQR